MTRFSIDMERAASSEKRTATRNMTTASSAAIRFRAGFTLIETLMVIGLTAVVGLAISNMILFTYRTNTYLYQQSAATDNARRGLDPALQNLREATYAADGSYPLSAAATSSVTFFSDVDVDGSVEKIRYYLSGTTFYRTITNPAGSPPSYVGQAAATSTIASYVKNFSANASVFRYYDSTGAELAAPIDVAEVRSISISVMVDVDPNRTPTTYSLTGSATFRNLRDTD